MLLNAVRVTEHSHLLQRCFTVRFRCLLDNASGFIVSRFKFTPPLTHRLKCCCKQSPVHSLIGEVIIAGIMWTQPGHEGTPVDQTRNV